MTPAVAAIHYLLREKTSYDLQSVSYTDLLLAVVEIFNTSRAPATTVDVQLYGTHTVFTQTFLVLYYVLHL